MSDFVAFKTPQMLGELVQALLDGKRLARSLENSVDALLPLVANQIIHDQLEEIRLNAAKAAHVLNQIYVRHAKEAFGQVPPNETKTNEG